MNILANDLVAYRNILQLKYSTLIHIMFLSPLAYTGESAIIRKYVTWFNLRLCKQTHTHTHKHTHAKFRGYGYNDARIVWYSCCSTYRTCPTWCDNYTMSRFVLEQIAKSNHAEQSAVSEVHGTLRMIFIKPLPFQANLLLRRPKVRHVFFALRR